jgi:hypothetical protein
LWPGYDPGSGLLSLYNIFLVAKTVVRFYTMVNSNSTAKRRNVPLASQNITGGEPLIDVARRRARVEGGSLRVILNELRNERLTRARELALAEAPPAVRHDDGTYQRVTTDPRWPFGVENGLVVAPLGMGVAGLPRTVDPSVRRNGPIANARQAQIEARDIISEKLKKLGCDPIAIMAQIAMDRENVKDEVRLRAAAELASMVYPRLRSVESTRRDETKVFVIGVPSEQPKTADAWLSSVGAPVIEGESRVVDTTPA